MPYKYVNLITHGTRAQPTFLNHSTYITARCPVHSGNSQFTFINSEVRRRLGPIRQKEVREYAKNDSRNALLILTMVLGGCRNKIPR